ncbi:lytic polysaccharide monooxygenase [Streptomyces sp. NPDC050560]|uniref:lytic polysaccharide monooxygenase auxiliary activity family 9 protein n=1 Tax=Streptomyces sp. NPDC050560 TaxID=3365630 RepID=UPI0037B60732
MNTQKKAVVRLLTLASAAALVGTLGAGGTASAHGTAITPPSRNFSCLDRWGGDFQNPAMADEDPMCWQAWQANPNTMWNWNGLYQDDVAGRHEEVLKDGHLCSGGQAQGGFYNSLDAVGDWTATDTPNNFTFVNLDAADHGADYYRVYVTKQGYDPTTQPLGWDDLELVAETGKILPGEGDPSPDPDYPGTAVSIPVSAPGRTGHHIVFMIWQASHKDQSFYSCSDVNFTG